MKVSNYFQLLYYHGNYCNLFQLVFMNQATILSGYLLVYLVCISLWSYTVTDKLK